jgi:hypothetical protein
MFRLTRKYRTRVSNRMAALAAFLLIVAAAAGLGNPLGSPGDTTPSLADGKASSVQQAEMRSNRIGSAKESRSFKISLFLFRRN